MRAEHMSLYFFFSSRRRHTRLQGDWSSDVCSSDLINAAAKGGILKVMMKSSVKQIEAESVAIEADGGVSKVRNDAVIVSAGGVLPSDFLKRVGITVETKRGTA